MNKDKISEYCFYLWLFVLPWQTKLILRAAPVNYLEIYFFLSWLLLLIPIFTWGVRIFKEDYWRFRKETNKPTWWQALIVWELITFISIFWADDKLLALFRYLILVLGILLFYLVKRTNFVKAVRVEKLFLIGLIPPAILGIWQFFTQSTFSSKYLGLAYHSANILGDSIIETSTGRYLRAYGSFDHPNILGGFMAIALILVLYSSLKKEIGRNERLFYLISFSIFYTALLVSFSRSGILAFFISVPFIIISAWRREVFQNKLIGLFILLLIFISATIIIPYQDLFFVRVQSQSRLEQKSISERELYLKQSANLIKQKPILGSGVGNYTNAIKVLDNYAQPYWYYQPVHNYWLLLWGEIGIFGFIAAVLFWLAIFKAGLKKGLWPIVIALLIFSLLDHWLWTQSLGLIIFFFLAGLMIRKD